MLAFYREYPYLEISPQAVAEIPTGLFFCRAMGPPRSVAQQDQGSPHACLVHASFRRERLEQGGAALEVEEPLPGVGARDQRGQVRREANDDLGEVAVLDE